jgi:hypothetical protein
MSTGPSPAFAHCEELFAAPSRSFLEAVPARNRS